MNVTSESKKKISTKLTKLLKFIKDKMNANLTKLRFDNFNSHCLH